MSCCSCDFLDEKKKTDGKVSGARYFCKKNKCYVGGNDDTCANYKSSFRSNSKCDEIFEDGKNFYDDDTSIMQHIIVLIIVVIAFIIIKIFNPDLFPF